MSDMADIEIERRLKQNESSRRSRINRKNKDQAIFNELIKLEEESQKLLLQDSELDRKTKLWEKKLIKLALKN